MRKQNLRIGLLHALVAIASMTCVGCMNDDYDFDNVDKTIGLGGDSIIIPTNSTEEIKLDDILDLKQNGSVKLDAENNYVFQLAGSNVTPAHPRTEPVKLRATSTVVNCVLPIRTQTRAVRINGESEKQLLFEYHGNSDVVKSISEAEVDPLTMNLNVKFPSDLSAALPTIDKLTIKLPGYLNIASASTNQAGATVAYEKNATGLFVTLQNVKTTQNLQLHLQTNSLSFENVGTEYGTLSINTAEQKIDMEGWVSLAVETNLNNISTELSSANVQVDVNFSNSYMTIRKATGRFAPSIQLNNLGRVTVTGIPDFLSDGNVLVDLDNPRILLTIDNDLNLAANIDGTVIATKDGQESARISLPQMKVGANGRTLICICRHATEDLIEAYGSENVYEQSDLSTLIERIPDEVAITNVTALADDQHEATYEFGKTYEVKPSYEVVAPLAFAEKAAIVYKDSLDDWNDKVKDLQLAEGAYLEVNGMVENRVPLYLTVDAYAIDLEGKAISKDRIHIDIPTKVIASYNGETTTQTKLVAKISEKEKGALKTVDGIVFRISGSAALEGYDTVMGVTLNADKHTIRLKDMRIKLVGKVIGDFN